MKPADPVMFRTATDSAAGTLFAPDTRTVAGHRAASVCQIRWLAILHELSQGDAAAFQIADAMGLEQCQISGRFGANDPGSLQYHGFIERTGDRATNPTGGAADVWRITDAGRAKLEELRNQIGGATSPANPQTSGEQARIEHRRRSPSSPEIGGAA